jgi:hypothetical protein
MILPVSDFSPSFLYLTIFLYFRADGILFACVAVLAACCLQGRFSALWILLLGEIWLPSTAMPQQIFGVATDEIVSSYQIYPRVFKI